LNVAFAAVTPKGNAMEMLPMIPGVAVESLIVTAPLVMLTMPLPPSRPTLNWVPAFVTLKISDPPLMFRVPVFP
jgi:hypothetical protein